MHLAVRWRSSFHGEKNMQKAVPPNMAVTKFDKNSLFRATGPKKLLLWLAGLTSARSIRILEESSKAVLLGWNLVSKYLPPSLSKGYSLPNQNASKGSAYWMLLSVLPKSECVTQKWEDVGSFCSQGCFGKLLQFLSTSPPFSHHRSVAVTQAMQPVPAQGSEKTPKTN